MYWNKFGDETIANKEKLKKIWNSLNFRSLNDVKSAIKIDPKHLRSTISSAIGMETGDELRKICQFYKEIKENYNTFHQFLIFNQIDHMIIENVFQNNAIYCVDSLEYMIKSKQDLRRFVFESGSENDNDNDDESKSKQNRKGMTKQRQSWDEIDKEELIKNLWEVISVLR